MGGIAIAGEPAQRSISQSSSPGLMNSRIAASSSRPGAALVTGLFLADDLASGRPGSRSLPQEKFAEASGLHDGSKSRCSEFRFFRPRDGSFVCTIDFMLVFGTAGKLRSPTTAW
jgi:hypothetical protein